MTISVVYVKDAGKTFLLLFKCSLSEGKNSFQKEKKSTYHNTAFTSRWYVKSQQIFIYRN